MAKVTVYDKEGKAHEVDSVDAKEYVASGGYTAENPNAEAGAAASSGTQSAAADEAVRQAAKDALAPGQKVARKR